MDNLLPSVKLLGTRITTASKEDILEFVVKVIKKREEKVAIFTPNPEILVAASRSESFQNTLNGAQVNLPDGVGVIIAGSILEKGIRRRITGVDFIYDLCEESVRNGFKIGLFGGEDGVAKRVSDCLRKKYPDLRVIYADSKWPMLYDNKNAKDDQILSNSPHIDILFVALGAPKQEDWITKNLKNIDVSVAMGVGGAFDYIAGVVPRAPHVVRELGMEWAFRLAVQPWRLRRQLALPLFAILVLKEKFFS